VTIRFVTHHDDTLRGKLADADLHFGDSAGALSGLTLGGFSVWQHPDRGRSVLFPVALRGDVGDRAAFDRLREAVIDAFARFEAGLPPEGPGGYRIA
jgi:hypothetical protein